MSTQHNDFTWNAAVVLNNTQRVLVRNMERAAMFVESAVIRSISVGQSVRRTKGGHVVGLNPSRPGEAPHVLLGRLRQSITHKVMVIAGQVRAFVGTNVIYAKRLELGYAGKDRRGRNINQAPRPYLRPAVRNNRSAIKRLISGVN
jgi:phage gpG-like protein